MSINYVRPAIYGYLTVNKITYMSSRCSARLVTTIESLAVCEY